MEEARQLTALRRTTTTPVFVRTGAPVEDIWLGSDSNAVAIGHADRIGVAAIGRISGGAGDVSGGNGLVGVVACAGGGERDEEGKCEGEDEHGESIIVGWWDVMFVRVEFVASWAGECTTLDTSG